MDLAAVRDAALAIVAETDAVALRWFRSGVDADTKADGSPVTAADREVERLVRTGLAERFGAVAVLGEEEGGEGLSGGQPTWVVDPIDATKNFVRGLPMWATLLALVVDGEPLVGVVSAPALGERWDAARGLGARRADSPVRVSTVAAVGAAQLLHGGLDAMRTAPNGWDGLGRLADVAWRTRGFGDWWMHTMVVDGRAEAAVERGVAAWDVAALHVLATEAGGRCTAWDGTSSPLVTGDVVTSNGAVHDEVVALLRG